MLRRTSLRPEDHQEGPNANWTSRTTDLCRIYGTFIDSKLADDGQVMKIGTLYKNFMGLGGPRDYGLTRRMIQIYLLCLAREGRIRIGLGPRSGLGCSHIDYANLKDIDFPRQF